MISDPDSEIWTDDHVHFLTQSVSNYNVTWLLKMIKSLSSRKVSKKCPYVKKQSSGEKFWSARYFASTVGKTWESEYDSNVCEGSRSGIYKIACNLPT